MGKQEDMLYRLLETFTEEEQRLVDENNFAYIFTKAYRYVQTGPAIYRRQDAFGQPSADLDGEELALVESGCRQVLEGRGLTPERPFTGLDVHGFYCLFRLFHYRLSQQAATFRDDGILDTMQLEHLMSGETVTYYNLVARLPPDPSNFGESD